MLSPPRTQRRGFTLIEISAAAFIMMATFALLAQVLLLVQRQERAAEARQLATQEAANRLERTMTLDWDKLTVGERVEHSVSAELTRLLPSAKLFLQVEQEALLEAKRVRVEISWQGPAGVAVQPIVLTAWKHRPAAEAQP